MWRNCAKQSSTVCVDQCPGNTQFSFSYEVHHGALWLHLTDCVCGVCGKIACKHAAHPTDHECYECIFSSGQMASRSTIQEKNSTVESLAQLGGA